MDESSGDFWMNTMSAQAYTGLNDLHLGKYFLSLFIIVLIMLVLAWLAHKAGWLKSAVVSKAAPQEQDQVIFYSQFSQDQTVLILEQANGIHCYIQKNNQTILATPLPGLRAQSLMTPVSSKGKDIPGKVTFQEVWKQVLGRKKGTRS